MRKDIRKTKCCSSPEDTSCCEVKAIVTIDERGQMVLPKEIRSEAKIRAGDRLAVITWGKDDKVCCISLMKIGELTDMVKVKLGPILKDII